MLTPKKGDLLISEPFSSDPNFKRTVVLITDHNEEGTVGFVLNKIYNLRLQDVIEDLSDFKVPLIYGGPVQLNTLHFIYRNHTPITDSKEIINGVYWGGNFDELKTIIKNKGISSEDILFFIGYSGWSENQLIGEIKENSWIVTKAKENFIFNKENSSLWKIVLNSMEQKYAIMSNFPEDPTLN